MKPEIPNRETVIALAKQGIPPREIALETGLSPNTVNYDLSQARKDGVELPTFKRGVPRRTRNKARLAPHVGIEVGKALAREALGRQLTVNVLVERLLEAIVCHNLVDAVLGEDDRDE